MLYTYGQRTYVARKLWVRVRVTVDHDETFTDVEVWSTEATAKGEARRNGTYIWRTVPDELAEEFHA